MSENPTMNSAQEYIRLMPRKEQKQEDNQILYSQFTPRMVSKPKQKPSSSLHFLEYTKILKIVLIYTTLTIQKDLDQVAMWQTFFQKAGKQYESIIKTLKEKIQKKNKYINELHKKIYNYKLKLFGINTQEHSVDVQQKLKMNLELYENHCRDYQIKYKEQLARNFEQEKMTNLFRKQLEIERANAQETESILMNDKVVDVLWVDKKLNKKMDIL